MTCFRFASLVLLTGLVTGFSGCRHQESAPGDESAPLGTSQEFEPQVPRSSDEVQLLGLTSDATPGQAWDFRGVLDAEGAVRALRYLSRSGETRDFPASGLTAGIVLMQNGSRKVVTLLSQNFQPSHGGTITLRYLYEGGLFSDKYRNFQMELRRDETGWALYRNDSSGRRRITRMLMKKNEKPVVGVVGIKEIVTD